jgi:hypothetical protein
MFYKALCCKEHIKEPAPRRDLLAALGMPGVRTGSAKLRCKSCDFPVPFPIFSLAAIFLRAYNARVSYELRRST